MNKEVIIYHNPKCSKSRQALEIIKSKNIEPTIIYYLETQLSKKEVYKLLSKLKLEVRDILRTGEDEYKNHNLKDENLSDDKLIEFLIKFPKLLQRPIFVKGDKAVIGRPPEDILNLL
ncbi:MAG: Arsenate reductase [Alphaproteobacteria bacterium MarineAlpha5_Bin5]|nr:MAG: Arsenate reductase [Alphaproteobacteria bacterium MarineAlpha5_Bin5]|tara:strand:- start:996 stop:1349 length:354 start_codon:yes stop_codon:yes gene_type:complete